MDTPYAVNQVSLDISPPEYPKRVYFAFDISDAIFPVLFANLGARGNPEAQPNAILRPEPGTTSYSWTDVLGYREMSRICGVIASGYASKVLIKQNGDALDNAIRVGWQNIATVCATAPDKIPLGLSSTLRVGPSGKFITFGFDTTLHDGKTKHIWPELFGAPGESPPRSAPPAHIVHRQTSHATYIWNNMAASYELVRVTNVLAQMFAHIGHPDKMASAATRRALAEAWSHLSMRFQ